MEKLLVARYGLLAVGMVSAVASAEPQRGPAIFRCEVQGRVTYSDTACATVSDRTQIIPGHLNGYTEDASIDRPKSGETKKQAMSRPQRRDSDDRERAKQDCQRLASRLAAIVDKLRAGYSAQEGVRLTRQQRQLEEQMRSGKCK